MVGKIGAFVGTYVYTSIINDLGGDDSKNGTVGPVYIGSGLCLLASVVTFFLGKGQHLENTRRMTICSQLSTVRSTKYQG